MGAWFLKAGILRPSGKLYLNNAQLNLVNGSETTVLLDTIGTGFTDGIEDTANHKITPAKPGLYFINAKVNFENAIADKRFCAKIKLNGATDISHFCCNASLNQDNLSCTPSCFYRLILTDYITLIAVSISGDNTVDIKNGEDETYLELQWIRP